MTITRPAPLTDAQRQTVAALIARHECSCEIMALALGDAIDRIEALDWPLGSPLQGMTVDVMVASLVGYIPHSVPARVYQAALDMAILSATTEMECAP